MHTSHQLTLRIDRWAQKRALRYPERNPKTFMILLMSAVSVAPTALGLQPMPPSMQEVPELLARGSVAAFAFGCLMCVVGIGWPKRDVGLAFEVAGCIILAVGCLGYSAALWIATVMSSRALVFGLVFGLALGSLARAGQIGLYVRGRRLNSGESTKASP